MSKGSRLPLEIPHHHVSASSISFAFRQAAKLIHSTALPFSNRNQFRFERTSNEAMREISEAGCEYCKVCEDEVNAPKALGSKYFRHVHAAAKMI